MADKSIRAAARADDATGAAGDASGATRDDPTGPRAIGRRVLRLRTERGLTQRQLAEPAYAAAYVSTLEAGRVRPSDAALRHLAKRLGTSPDELATGRSPRAATELRMALTDARRTLATGTARERFEEAERLLADEPLPRRVPAIRGRATAHLLAGDRKSVV